MKRLIWLTCTVALCILSSVTFAQAKPRFGLTPANDLYSVAQNNQFNKCGLSASRLDAAMVAVTYGESGGGGGNTHIVPAPSTLGRYDTEASLYEASSSSNPRLFWTPGIGLFQLDDAGLGTNTAIGKFTSSGSAPIVAKVMNSAWCSSHDTKSMFQPWDASCGSDFSICNRIFDSIYNPGGSPNLTTVSGVADGGGNESHVCQLGSSPSAHEFACVYVNRANFHPTNTLDTGSPNPDPSEGKSPIPYPFYVFRDNVSTSNGIRSYEVRYFSNLDTGLAQNWIAMRPFGDNSRNHLLWRNPNTGICDLTTDSGACPPTKRPY